MRGSQITDFDACPCSGTTLDKLIQPAVLAVLARGQLHGYRIAKRLAQMRLLKGREPDASGVYRFLKSMEDKGLVVSAWDLSEKGPARKSYRITRAGTRCLKRWMETLEEYQEAIADLLRTAAAAVR
jgi:PadR family transcriptional regulator PadR